MQCFLSCCLPCLLAGLPHALPHRGAMGRFCCKQLMLSCFHLLQVLMLSLLGSPREMVAMEALGTFGDIRGDMQNTEDTLSPMVWILAW